MTHPDALPRIYADFHKCDVEGRVELVCVGTKQDLERLGLELAEGLRVLLYMDDGDDLGRRDDIQVEAVVAWAADAGCWVGLFDENDFHHQSDVEPLPPSAARDAD
ncbi:MAG: hypothetical protein QNJ98_03555 [Planctomycetota bacterium]|nr:hypothetical protein [Planctomycetota bacterium]